MSCVGLDISTNCGVAYWPKDSARPIWSTVRLPGEPGEVGRPMEKLRQHLGELHQFEAITHLFFEATLLPPPKIGENGRAFQMTTADTVYKLCSLAGMAEWFAYRIEAHCRQVEQQRWRKHFLGKGTGTTKDLKALAIKTCHDRGWAVKNDHEAEAIGVLDFGLHCFNIDTPWRDAGMFDGAMARATA